MRSSGSITILVADDDADDCWMIEEALKENSLAEDLHFVHDGEQLLDYLHGRGAFDGLDSCPRPSLILLDLNMPRMDGREALREIKGDSRLCDIPVVVLTTSGAEEDLENTCRSGICAFVTKPETFGAYVTITRDFWRYSTSGA